MPNRRFVWPSDRAKAERGEQPLSAVYGQDLGDRKEMVVGLLARLTRAQQREFLRWCCGKLNPYFAGTRIEGDVSGAGESWYHLCYLCTQHGMDFETARAELERRVRLFGRTRSVLPVNLQKAV